jgi:hypothetical protein
VTARVVATALALFLLGWNGGLFMEALKYGHTDKAIISGIMMVCFALSVAYTIHKKEG